MKRILAVALLLAAVFSLSGCASGISPNTVYSIDGMNGSDIGVIRNSVGAELTDGLGTQHVYGSAETMLVELKNGYVDCAVTFESTAKDIVKKFPGIRILDEELMEADFSFAIAKENPELTEVINDALRQLEGSGMLEQMIDGYLLNTGYTYTSPEDVDRSAGTLTLAVDINFAPYASKDDRGRIVGLDIDIARAVCDYLQIDLEVTAVDRENLVKTVQFGKADFSLGGLTNNEEDLNLVDFSDTYMTCTQVVVVRK